MAVLRSWRGLGVGRALLARLIWLAEEQGLSRVWLTAQVGAIEFYRRAGFVAEGTPFLEAGIPHQKMIRRLAP
jgi:predicted GNAT family N-acyltransferase